jgi:hypothetical protein
MTDYQPLLARAIGNLERNTSEARRAVYDRARQALLNQLRAVTPPLSDPEITRERLALEDAIRKIETQAAQANPEPARASRIPAAAPRPTAAPPRSPPAREPQAPAPPRATPREPGGSQPRPPFPPRTQMPPPAEPRVDPRMLSPNAREPERSAAPRPPEPQTARPREPMRADSGRTRNELHGEKHPPSPAPRVPAGFDYPEEELAPPETVHVPPAREPRVASDELGVPRPRRPQPPAGTIAAPADKGGARTTLVVAGLILLVFVAAALLAYIHRDRVLALFGAGSSAPQTASDSEKGKAEDRVSPQAGAPPRSAAPPAAQAPAVGQTATLYEENPGGAQQFQNFAGTVVWRTETVAVGPGRAPDLALRADIDIPDRKMSVKLILRRNMDASFPASHTLEVQFTNPGDPFGGVSNVRGMRGKNAEAANGSVFGLSEPEKIKEGDILFALPDTQLEQNIQLLRDRPWFDIAFFYNNGRRAVLAFEKGTPGERAVSQALAAWGQGG